MSRIIIGRYGRNAHHNDIRSMLGLPEGAKLPREGMPPRTIQGITVWVAPLVGPAVPRRTRYQRPLAPKSSTHRALAQCACGKVLSVGRLHQHVCKEA